MCATILMNKMMRATLLFKIALFSSDILIEKKNNIDSVESIRRRKEIRG